MAQQTFFRLPSTANEIIVAINPNAGSNSTELAATRLTEALEQRGYHVRSESDLKKIRDFVSQTTSLRAVVAAGGDGTIALLANELPPKTPFAILPQGTENLLAKYLGLPTDPLGVAEIIDRGLTVKLDAGRANGKLFLVMASCGFDAEVVHQVHKSRKGNIRHWAYAKPIIDSIRKYRYPTVSVFCDDRPIPVKAKWAFVFNVPRYAMGLAIADDADSMDGLLDLCTFRGGNLLNGLMYLAGVVTRMHKRWRDTKIVQAKRLRLVAEEEVPFQLDGDPGGFLPLNIEVVPQRLSVMVPEPWATKQKLFTIDEMAGDLKSQPSKRILEVIEPTERLS